MARKRKSAPKIPTFNDAPTQERLKQDGGAGVEVVDRNLRGEATRIRYKAKVSCKLDWYLVRGSITEQMHRAGSRFAEHFFYAGKSKRLTPMYGEFIASGRTDFDPYIEKTAAQEWLEKSLAVLTPDERDVVWTVCGQDNNIIKRSDIRHLQTGLRALAVFYGYE